MLSLYPEKKEEKARRRGSKKFKKKHSRRKGHKTSEVEVEIFLKKKRKSSAEKTRVKDLEASGEVGQKTVRYSTGRLWEGIRCKP